jgi:hypothetical protein
MKRKLMQRGLAALVLLELLGYGMMGLALWWLEK